MGHNELRVGNLFQDQHGNFLTVDSIVHLGHQDFNIMYHVVDRSKYPLPEGWKAEPVPINVQTLSKIGFTREKDGQYYHGEIINTDNGVYIDLYYVSSRGGFQVRIADQIFINLDYIHELQNLVFALTRIELTLKQ